MPDILCTDMIRQAKSYWMTVPTLFPLALLSWSLDDNVGSTISVLQGS